MDVTFLEAKTFFPKPVPHSSLQGEILSEALKWESWPGFEDTSIPEYQEDHNDTIEINKAQHALVEDQPKEIIDQMEETEIAEIENEQLVPYPLVPDDQSPENILEV